MGVLSFSSLLLLFVCTKMSEASGVTSRPTFPYREPSTGQTLNCTKCPPGFHMSAYCSATTPTQCTPCKKEYFTDLWNYLPRCFYCHNFCHGNMEVESECSPVSNRVCRCKEGFYWFHDFCVPHSTCDPGYGVHTIGTRTTDTVCEECPSGHFSDTSSAFDTCVKRKECGSEEFELIQGSTSRDTLCGSCENLVNGSEILRTFLTEFINSHKTRVWKLETFVRNVSISRENKCTGHLCKRGSKRDLLKKELGKWIFNAPKEQLKGIPQMLRDSQMRSMAQSLENQFREIRERCGSEI